MGFTVRMPERYSQRLHGNGEHKIKEGKLECERIRENVSFLRGPKLNGKDVQGAREVGFTGEKSIRFLSFQNTFE